MLGEHDTHLSQIFITWYTYPPSNIYQMEKTRISETLATRGDLKNLGFLTRLDLHFTPSTLSAESRS